MRHIMGYLISERFGRIWSWISLRLRTSTEMEELRDVKESLILVCVSETVTTRTLNTARQYSI
jgi:hypothetical protein